MLILRHPLAAGALIVAMTLAAYAPLLHAGYVWDDDAHIGNAQVIAGGGSGGGGGGGGIWRIWTHIGATVQYYPLAYTAFWIEYHLWGANPPVEHAVNVLLHACSALLLWRILERIGLRPAAAWLAAAIFAVHPIEVESVAWITELKNVLMLVFYLLAVAAYLRFDPQEPDEGQFPISNFQFEKQKPNPPTQPGDKTAPPRQIRNQKLEIRNSPPLPTRPWAWYALSLILFTAAMLTKTVAASLPAALLILYWWRRPKWTWRDAAPLTGFVLIGLPLGLQTAWMERTHVHAVGPAWDLSPVVRCLIAARALWFYVGKLLLPVELCFSYSRWQIDPASLRQWLFVAGVAAVAAVLWLGRERWGRGPMAAAAFFTVSLVPALGFFNVYPMRYSFVADHFQYVAGLGLIVLLCGAAVALADRIALPRLLRVAVAAALLGTLGWLTAVRCDAFKNPTSLWRDTLAKNPSSGLAHLDYGVILLNDKQPDEAIIHFQKALEADPDSYEAEKNLGLALARKNDLAAAIPHYQRAVSLAPNNPAALHGLGRLLAMQGRDAEAIPCLEKAAALSPGNAEYHYQFALVLMRTNQFRRARNELNATLEIQPDHAAAWQILQALEKAIAEARGATQPSAGR